jgi:hypothetical protein
MIYQRLPSALLSAAYLALIGAGIYGFAEEPATSIKEVIGQGFVSGAWNSALILAGLMGILSRVYRAPRTEIVAIDIAAGVFGVWAVVVFFASASNQAAFAFLACMLLLFGWASGARIRLAERVKLRERHNLEEE